MRVKVLKDYISTKGNLHKAGTEEEWPNSGVVQRALVIHGFAEVVTENAAWEPKFGEEYYYLDDEADICGAYWSDDGIDDGRSVIGNRFRTKREVGKARSWLQALKVLLDDSKRYRPKKGSGRFYFVSYDLYMNKFFVDYLSAAWPGSKCYSPITFRSEEDAQASIDKHAKEWKIFLGIDE